MSRPEVLVLAALPNDLRAALAQLYDLVDVAGPRAGARANIEVAVTTGMAGAGGREFDLCPGLKLLVSQGVGLDRIDLPEARRRGIAVAHTPDELTEDVGDAAIAMIYAALRGIVRGDRFVRAGRWTKERMAPSHRVSGRTVGIVGLGRIGRHVARRAEAIGMTVLYHGRRAVPDVGYPYVASLPDLASCSDVLVACCAGGEATRHLIGREVLTRLGAKGVLVNVARGSVVDEDALLDLLETGALGGAALDVFEGEPTINPRFLTLENVVLAPHAASITHETRAAIIRRMLDDIDAFRSGRPFHDAAAR